MVQRRSWQLTAFSFNSIFYHTGNVGNFVFSFSYKTICLLSYDNRKHFFGDAVSRPERRATTFDNRKRLFFCPLSRLDAYPRVLPCLWFFHQIFACPRLGWDAPRDKNLFFCCVAVDCCKQNTPRALLQNMIGGMSAVLPLIAASRILLALCGRI